MTDKEKVFAAMEKSIQILGGIGVFIHAAGVAPGGVPAEETTDEIRKLAMSSNAASKGAVTAWSRTMASEWADYLH